MDLLQNMALGFATALMPDRLLACFIGVLIGTLIGVLPGIGPAAAISLLLPSTFHLDPTSGIIMLAGIYYGAMYGGSTTSVLVNIPGEAASVVTCLDGYQMARQGRAGAALGISAMGSFIAGTLSVIGLMLVAPPLARFALSFGPPEYFALFYYSAAQRAFEDVAAEDHSCAIAAWGYASILMLNPLQGIGSSPKNAQLAQAAIDKGRQMGAKTQRERDYLEAVAAYYEDFANRPERARQLARANAYEALAARYPDDDEAQIFYALYLAGTQTASDQTYSAYLKAAAILEKQFEKHPDHPGVAHYLIHSYDAPPIAAQGLPAARRYAVSPRTRRTRSTCPHTSSPVWARGPIRRRPTAGRPMPQRGATSPMRPCTRWTT